MKIRSKFKKLVAVRHTNLGPEVFKVRGGDYTQYFSAAAVADAEVSQFQFILEPIGAKLRVGRPAKSLQAWWTGAGMSRGSQPFQSELE
jgi:hypothetical protein